MALVATLIANPDRPAITEAVLAEAGSVLRARQAPRVLHDGVAAEIVVDDTVEDAAIHAARLRAAFVAEPIDVAVLPADAHRRKQLLVADMDSTMIEQECIDELAGMVGLRDHVAAITERAMRGEIAFEPALRERVALLRDLPVAVVAEVIRERINLMPGARTLVRTMRGNGAHTCLVSGGFTLFTGPIGETIGFDETHANRLVQAGGRLAGMVEEPIVGREAKRATLVALRERLGLGRAQTLAVGDGANDLCMLGEAGLGVAFRAKPAVARAAGARIEYGDLTALLYLQGYRADEFVA